MVIRIEDYLLRRGAPARLRRARLHATALMSTGGAALHALALAADSQPDSEPYAPDDLALLWAEATLL